MTSAMSISMRMHKVNHLLTIFLLVNFNLAQIILLILITTTQYQILNYGTHWDYTKLFKQIKYCELHDIIISLDYIPNKVEHARCSITHNIC